MEEIINSDSLTIADKRKWMNRYYWLDLEAKELESQIEKLRLQQMLPSLVTKVDPVQGGKLPDPMVEYICELENLEQKLITKKSQSVKAYTEILDAISMMDNEKYRFLLMQRYISHRKFEDIGSIMRYEKSRIYELHCEALASLEIKKDRTKTENNM